MSRAEMLEHIFLCRLNIASTYSALLLAKCVKHQRNKQLCNFCRKESPNIHSLHHALPNGKTAINQLENVYLATEN